MSSQRAQCPICSEEFPMYSINKHIDDCLQDAQGSDSDQRETSPRRKRARISSYAEAGSETSQGPVERAVSRGRLSQDKPQPVEEGMRDGAFNVGKKVTQWGSLLRPSNKATKADLEPALGKKKMSSAAPKTTAFNRTVSSSKASSEATIPSTATKTHSASSSSSLSSSSVPSSMNRTMQGRSNETSTTAKTEFRPLAERVRPLRFTEFVGQEKAVGQQSLLRQLLEDNVVPSMIFWGPPGCGKTTLANIIAQRAKASGKARFVPMSATLATVATVKDAVTVAANEQRMTKRKTILFIDEIHRFNKLQQDTFLPHVENGTITLIGATTENPSFKINNALLSRCRVVVLNKLSTEDVMLILRRAASELGVRVLEERWEEDSDEGGSSGEDELEEDGCTNGRGVCIEKTALTYLANLCDGDARSALNTLQMVVESRLSCPCSGNQSQVPARQRMNGSAGPQVNGLGMETVDGETRSVISTSHIKEALQRSHVMYDREGEEHYNCISALHKSMRGSDANAALYWLARMLVGGEDPLYIARRLIAFASEDVGLADPQALTQAVSTHQACQFLGVPACEVILAQCVIYLSRAPKSSEVEGVLMCVKKYIEDFEGPLPGVPLHLRPGSTQLMRDLGYGKGYVHSAAAGDQGFLPESMRGIDFFQKAAAMFKVPSPKNR